MAPSLFWELNTVNKIEIMYLLKPLLVDDLNVWCNEHQYRVVGSKA